MTLSSRYSPRERIASRPLGRDSPGTAWLFNLQRAVEKKIEKNKTAEWERKEKETGSGSTVVP